MLAPRILFLIALVASPAGYSQPNLKVAKSKQDPGAITAMNGTIQVHAVVTDRAGQLVEGLSKEDFRLMEDGVQQTPAFFAMEKIAGKSDLPLAARNEVAPGMPGDSPGPVAPSSSRVMVLVVDTVHISSNGLERVRMALAGFLDEQKTGQDLIAIMTTSGKPGRKGEFTADRGKLDEDIKKIRPGQAQFESFLTPALCGKVVRRDPQAVSLATLIIRSDDRTSGSMVIPDSGNPEVEAASKCMMMLLEAASRRRAVAAAIGTAIEKMSTLPGQRLIALFTEGFSMVGPGGETAIPDINPVISSAVRAGIMIYAFDARVAMSSKQLDIESYNLSSEIQNSVRDYQLGMALLASETGGEAFYNLDGLPGQLQQMLGGSRVYYRLAYFPPSGKASKKYRSINVSVKDHPEYHVRTQKGYMLYD